VNLRPIIAWRTEVRDGRPSDRTAFCLTGENR
jgi:hypothetical protein